ncbi:hypothetical protein ON010_g10289 [Phytophthora cinnamomi]|nr:hypothetical protein ON010_g10289 [Phytophthora cinnamomi]
MRTLGSGALVGTPDPTSQVMSPTRARAGPEGSNSTLDTAVALPSQLDAEGLPLDDQASRGDRMLLEANRRYLTRGHAVPLQASPSSADQLSAFLPCSKPRSCGEPVSAKREGDITLQPNISRTRHSCKH